MGARDNMKSIKFMQGFQIFVKTISGKSIPFGVHAEAQVKDLKQILRSVLKFL